MNSKKSLLVLFTFSVLSLINCTNNSSKQETSAEVVTEAVDNFAPEVVITGFASIEKLAASVVKSIQEKDYDSYYSHVMSEEMEIAQAARIDDEKIRNKFLHEYGFSIHEENEYFNNLIHYFSSKNIDLSKATLEDMEYVEYKGGEYEPVMLYEVFIPIEMEVESLIDFTIIEVDKKFYLTSELGF